MVSLQRGMGVDVKVTKQVFALRSSSTGGMRTAITYAGDNAAFTLQYQLRYFFSFRI
jgi:hypothetical protein